MASRWDEEIQLHVIRRWLCGDVAQRKTVSKNYLSARLKWVCWFLFETKQPFPSSSFLSSSSRGISFEIPLVGDPELLPCEAPSACGMSRSASSDSLGFKVHYAAKGGMKRQLSATPVSVNGQHIPEEDEDFTPQKPLGRNNTFSIKNQNRYRKEGNCIWFYFMCYKINK